MTLETVEISLPERAVFLDPARHALRPRRLKPVNTFPANALFGDDMCLAQHAQMFRNRRAALGEFPGKRVHRRRSNAQPVKDRAPGRIGDCAKDVGFGVTENAFRVIKAALDIVRSA
jgi:hypothetical protein